MTDDKSIAECYAEEVQEQESSTQKERRLEIEALKWKKFKVLNDGFICLVDVMGTDADIVQAARVSYGEGTKHISDNQTLIRYLMRHRHTTPFEMCELKFLVRVPMDCWRQWIRHRTANVNEYSTRYSEAIDSQQKTDPAEWRAQAKTNKQGSGDFLKSKPEPDGDGGHWLSVQEETFHRDAMDIYNERLKLGVAREQARKDLPLSTYTEAYWKIDLHNLFHFLGLRMDSHAQLEIRSYANVIGEITKQLFPIAWEAFEDYRLNGMFLTALDIKVIQYLQISYHTINEIVCDEIDLLTQEEAIEILNVAIPEWKDLKRCRERDECIDKLAKLNLIKKKIKVYNT